MSLHNNQIKWILFIQKIFQDCGFSNIWESQNFVNKEWLKTVIKQRLLYQYIQNWNSLIQNSSKGINYKNLKKKLEIEEYFNILDFKDAIVFCRFQTTNTKLPIETGRWQNVIRENRFCSLCNNRQIGDEYHFIFECKFFNQKRKEFLTAYFTKRQNTVKFSEVMSSTRKPVLKKLCFFYIENINTCVCRPVLVLLACNFCNLSRLFCTYCKYLLLYLLSLYRCNAFAL